MDVQLIECGQHIDFDRVPPVGGISFPIVYCCKSKYLKPSACS